MRHTQREVKDSYSPRVGDDCADERGLWVAACTPLNMVVCNVRLQIS